jgi:RNA polymerase sigma factor (sigma-70 family)
VIHAEDTGTVFVVESDHTSREALVDTVRSGWRRAEAFDSAGAFLRTVSQDHRGCVVAGVRLPRVSGLDLQRELQQRDLALPIIFITAFGEVATAVEAMRNGAFDFLQKPVEGQRLLNSIERAFVWEAKAAELRRRRHRMAGLLQKLSAREREVLEMMADGWTTRAIADELGVSVKTVEVHRHHIMGKLEVHAVPELINTLWRSNACTESPMSPPPCCVPAVPSQIHLARSYHPS